jgi:nanoRNase/pAp phosphatase (c-di-AMP/oligoRNAs hydrolase)
MDTFNSWCSDENMLKEMVQTGTSIQQTIDTQSARAALKLKEGFYGENRVRRGNVVGNVSLVGNKAVENGKADFSATYFFKEDGIVVSLRADKATYVDVSTIAKYFGGGGHAKAAGFEIALPLGQRGTDAEALKMIGLELLWPTHGR